MHAIRDDEVVAPGTRIVLNPWGEARIEEHVHRGRLFDVLRARVAGEVCCIKTPRTDPGPRDASEAAFTSHAYGIETSVFGGATGRGLGDAGASIALADSILVAEAARIAQTGGAWNHHVDGMGIWDAGRPGASWDAEDGRHHARRLGAFHDPEGRNPHDPSRYRTALVMPWHDGRTLDRLDARSLRRVLPGMMPALWDALCVQSHGDLSLSNLLLLSSGERFVLLDPGVVLLSRIEPDRHLYLNDSAILTTNAWAYPLIPPHASPEAVGGPGRPLRDVVARLVERVRSDCRGSVIACGPTGCPPSRRDAPLPADLLAIGILYYHALTGRHPFHLEGGPVAPAWVGEFGEMERDPENWTRAVEAVRRGPLPPREIDPGISDGESCLALALLALEVDRRDYLVGLVREAARA